VGAAARLDVEEVGRGGSARRWVMVRRPAPPEPRVGLEGRHGKEEGGGAATVAGGRARA
jgi:hypothetical protein